MSVMWQRQTHGVPRRKETIDRLAAGSFLAVILIVTALVGGYLTLVASMVHVSREIWQTHDQLAEIRRQNSHLQTQIALKSAIPELQRRSVALSYQPAMSIEYMYVETP
jgi:hypothetical protein